MRPIASRNFTLVQFILCSIFCCLVNVSLGQTVASFSASQKIGCAPLNVNFTNTSTGATSYSWNFGNSNSSTQQNPSNVYSTPGNYTVTLTATGSAGVNVTSINITVVPPPIANFNVSQNVGCQEGDVFQFQNLSSNYDSSLWDFGDGTTSNLQNPSHVYSSGGVFSVKLIAYNKQLGCSDIKVKSAYLTIHPKPETQVTVDTFKTCDSTHRFQFSGTSLTPVTLWKWDFGDGTTGLGSSISHTYNSSSSFQVSLVTINSFGCADTNQMDSLIIVYNNPSPVIVLSGNSGCTPFSLNLVCTTTGTSYLWNFGNGNTATKQNCWVIYDSAGTYFPNLIITNANGCSRSVTTNPIIVEQGPDPVFNMVNYVGCAPLTVQFNNLTLPGNFTWYWDFGDGTTSTLNNPTHIYDSIGYFVPSLVATSPNGCTNIEKNGWYYVNVNGPTAAFKPDVLSGCLPLTVNFTSNSTTAVQWNWNFGDGGTSTSQHPTHIYQTLGTFSVTLIVTNAQGCKDTLVYSTNITTTSSNVNFVPPAPITACSPHTIHLADASGAASWLWDFGDGTTSTLANPFHTYITPGTYTVSLTTWMPNGGCSYTIPNFQTFIIDGAVLGFTYTVSSCPPYEVFFTDTSSNVSSWQWSFGDGGNSTQQSPSYIYPNPGNYDITVIGTTPIGCNTRYFINDGVQFTGLGASATASGNDSVAPYTIQLYSNATNANWYLWTFGDGDSSSLANPIHDFATPGPYNISLTIGNDSCVFTYDYPPITFGSSSSGGGLGGGGVVVVDTAFYCAPYKVNFSNPAPSASSLLWIFGDGTTSTLLDPMHIYSDSGVFVPLLIATYSNGTVDTIFFSDIFRVVKPITDFNITTVNTCGGVIVNVSSPHIASTYNWNFGNGNTFTTPSPSLTYPNSPASYIISLNSIDTFGCGAFVAKSFAITNETSISSDRRRACANDTINFSVGNLNFASYVWDFGDGTISTVKNPQHVYTDSGLFQVILRATDINGCSIIFPLNVLIEVFNPIPIFTFYKPHINCNYVGLIFQNQSTGSTNWLWNFGDGGTSTLQNPNHYFHDPGYHDITLTASKNICSKSITIPNAVYVAKLIPNFFYSLNTLCLPSLLSFTDSSFDAVEWRWDFGDGDSSNLQNPTHIYTDLPYGPITLKVKDVNGCVKTISKPAPQFTKADFVSDLVSGCNPLTVSFTDSSSNSVSWLWDFGDGTQSNLQNPTHVYTQDGYFDLSFIVTSNSGCVDTLFIDSLISLGTAVANFSADSTVGCVPLLVSFVDASTTTDDWYWDFGDGTSSTLANPSHIYDRPGVYSVKLIARNSFGCVDSIIKQNYITVRGSVPYFTIQNTNGCAPLMVSFQDSSQNVVDWEWNFGDGITDSISNPIHLYQDTGKYVVTLYTTDSTGCTSVFISSDTIRVLEAPNATFLISDSIGCAPFSIQINSQFAVADSLIWDMGDGTILFGDNPSYTYNQPGVYQITLTAKNGVGCSKTLIYPSSIRVNSTPQANFSISSLVGCNPLQIHFTNLSANLFDATYLWDFGNGDTDTSFAPSYTYLSDGDFLVTLSVLNQGGCSSVYSSSDTLIIYDSSPPAPTSLYRASVVTNQSTEINWKLSHQRDIAYYNIYRLNPISSNFDSIANVVWSNTSTSGSVPHYVDSNLNTLANAYTYKVQTVNMCGSKPELFLTKEHTTINVESVPSLMRVDLSWTPYIGCEFFNYEIYRADATGTFTLIASVDTSATSYADTTTICPFPYTYRIKATSICNDSGYDSWSDSTIATPTSNIQDQLVEIVRSTVVNNSYVLTEWKKPTLYTEFVEHYDIYRSSDDINYSLIATVPSIVQDYSDMNVDVNQNRYTYKVFPGNSCNIQAAQGNISSNILLEALQSEFTNDLKWTRYVNWGSGVEKYVIEKLNSAGNWEQIKVLNGSITNWTEE